MLPRVVVATLRALESEENILTDYKIIGNEKGDTIIVLKFSEIPNPAKGPGEGDGVRRKSMYGDRQKIGHWMVGCDSQKVPMKTYETEDSCVDSTNTLATIDHELQLSKLLQAQGTSPVASKYAGHPGFDDYTPITETSFNSLGNIDHSGMTEKDAAVKVSVPKKPLDQEMIQAAAIQAATIRPRKNSSGSTHSRSSSPKRPVKITNQVREAQKVTAQISTAAGGADNIPIQRLDQLVKDIGGATNRHEKHPRGSAANKSGRRTPDAQNQLSPPEKGHLNLQHRNPSEDSSIWNSCEIDESYVPAFQAYQHNVHDPKRNRKLLKVVHDTRQGLSIMRGRSEDLFVIYNCNNGTISAYAIWEPETERTECEELIDRLAPVNGEPFTKIVQTMDRYLLEVLDSQRSKIAKPTE